MRPIIPGHARGYTLWLLGILAIFLFPVVEEKMDAAYVLLAFAVAFLGDQATHLAQHDHAGPAPTWLEDQLHKRQMMFRCIGVMGAAIFMLLALAF